MYSIGDSTYCQNLWCCWSFFSKTILTFPQNFQSFWFYTFEKQRIIYPSSNKKKNSNASVDNSDVTFLWKVGGWLLVVHLSVVLCFYVRRCKIEVVNHQFHSLQCFWGYPRGLMIKAMDCGIVVSEFVLSRATTFTFGQIALGKVWTPLSSQLCVK